MLLLSIILDGDNALEDWKDRKMYHLGNNAPPIRVMALEGGMKSGAPSVGIGIDLGDDGVVLAETSLRLFLLAADALRAKFDPEGENDNA